MRGIHVIVAALALIGLSADAAHAQQFSQTRVNVGQAHEGRLTANLPTLSDGSYADCLVLQTVQGRNYTVTMRSREFDTYLLAASGGCQNTQLEFSNDDFESSGTDSQISFTATATTYALFVNSYGAGATGRYTLSVAEGGAGGSAAANSGAANANAGADPAWSQGWAAFERADYSGAYRLLRPFADAGEPSAQNAMGFMHFFGRGVAQNRLEASRWYGLAAAQGNEQAQRALNEYAPHIMEARFVDHIDRYGPSTADVHSFHYDVNVYCIYRGPNCSTWRRRAQEFQDAQNARAEAANMRRIWGLYGGNSEQEARQYRERSECLRRVTESIQRQTYGQQTWHYVNNCD